MARPARRATLALWLQFEPLDPRTLLSSGGLSTSAMLDPGPNSSVLVRFEANASAAEIQSALAPLSARIVQSFPDGPSLIALGKHVTPARAVAKLEAYPFVQYAEPNAVIHVKDTFTNDPDFAQQWGLSNPATGISIDAPAAWDVTHGSPNIIVAVVDSGIDTKNHDLGSQLWTNPATGQHGWNFINNNANITDYDGHGTHVSGIIAAAGNNGYGVVGVAWGVKLMPLKFIGANGNGDTDQAVQAIYYAVQHGANVINASWGGPQYDQSLQDAIAYANAHNVVFSTAAGNESVNNDVTKSYPANNRLPNTLSVAAVDINGDLADFSNYGPTTVDLAAPGEDIVSTVPGGFASYSGTSMSAAFVSGVAALVLSEHPTWSAAQVVQDLVATARPLPSLAGRTISGGMVDAAAAVGVPEPWLNQSHTLGVQTTVSDTVVHAQIDASNEFFAVHGGTNVGFIEGLYQDVLGRPVDAASLWSWETAMQNGASRAGVAQGIIDSPEAAQTEVARWFIDDLNRTESLANLKQEPTIVAWGTEIANGQVTADQIHADILASPEYYTIHGATLSGFVEGLYTDLVDRSAIPAEVNAVVAQITSGLSLSDTALAILGSPEAKLTEVAQWYISDLERSSTTAQLELDAGAILWSRVLSGS